MIRSIYGGCSFTPIILYITLGMHTVQMSTFDTEIASLTGSRPGWSTPNETQESRLGMFPLVFTPPLIFTPSHLLSLCIPMHPFPFLMTQCLFIAPAADSSALPYSHQMFSARLLPLCRHLFSACLPTR